MSRASQIILLVEDEPLVQWVAREILEESGHEVIPARTADEALQILQSRKDVGLLFTDVDMPGSLNGMELAELVHRTWPAVRLVVTSGKRVDRPVPDDGAFLPRPYTAQDLDRAINKASRAAQS